MSRRNPEASLLDMSLYATEAVELLDGASLEELAGNRERQLALTRLVEIVGEAAHRIPQSVQEQYPQIPWADIVGMRNRLVHGYDNIDLDLLWDTIINDLPPLIAQLEEMIKEL